MKRYIIKENYNGLTNLYYLYEVKGLVSEELKLIKIVSIKNDEIKSDEDILFTIIRTLPNGTEGSFEIERLGD